MGNWLSWTTKEEPPIPKLLMFVSGFGSPYLDHKLLILENNVKIVKDENNPWKGNAEVWACWYDDAPAPEVEGVTFIQEKGIVGQFIKRHLSSIDSKFTDVLLIMDDVSLFPVDWKLVEEVRTAQNPDIVSPNVTGASWHHMFPIGDSKYRVQTACEFYCYLMPRASCEKYANQILDENPWMWGTDFVLTDKLGLKVVLINTSGFKAHHSLHQTSYTKFQETYDPFQGMNAFLLKHGISSFESLNPKEHEKFILAVF